MLNPDVPRQMRAVLLKGHGGFEQLEYRDDVPVPQPAEGEVLIRIGAAAINNTDIATRSAWYAGSVDAGARAVAAGWTGAPMRFPRIQGADACGRIVATGTGVDMTRIGQRVLVEPLFPLQREGATTQLCYLGSECDGAFAEYMAVPAAYAHGIGSTLSDAELASFPCAYSTAENMLARVGVKRGERVLVTGASGGVGSAAVQLALRRGAEVIAVAAASKAARLLELGASRLLERDAALCDELGLEAVDVVVDLVGGPQFPDLLRVLRRGGRYAVSGAIGGAEVELDLRSLYLKDIRLLGCTVLESGVFAALVDYIERGEIEPLMAQVYPLREIVAAQQAFVQKRHLGKIVLQVAT